MATHQSISPFPADIDRDAYGWLLTGLTAGEGCFRLGWCRHRNKDRLTGTAYFCLALRADDLACLERIQSYWQVGLLYWSGSGGASKSKPTWRYTVSPMDDLVGVVVPHFERFPLAMLETKKARDFEIWKAAVLLCWQVKQRRKVGRGYCKGTGNKWRPDELATFGQYVEAMKATRTYDASTVAVPSPVVTPSERTLFD